MTNRDFGQYCGLARALELVGERWTMLIVRDLLAGPRRFTDLLDGLPGIPTNVLSTRLKELEASGIVERQVAPSPQRGVLYAMTEMGEALQPAIITLAVWGNSQLGEPRPGEFVPATTVAMTMRATFDSTAAEGLTATWELRAPDLIVHAQVIDGALRTGDGPAPVKPDLVMTFKPDDLPTFRALIQAAKGGLVELEGRQRLLATFLRIFAPKQAA
jgi:DNA-binding HxlR family transcriptional regulator